MLAVYVSGSAAQRMAAPRARMPRTGTSLDSDLQSVRLILKRGMLNTQHFMQGGAAIAAGRTQP